MNALTKVTPTNENLFELVAAANHGNLALPQFQRSFVWEPNDVYELLLSIFKGYFIGSLLVMNIDPFDQPFAVRPIEGSNLEDKDMFSRTSRLLLDGQQRITSLHYAFYSPNIPLKRKKTPTRFFLRLAEFSKGDIDNSIFYKPYEDCLPEELVKGDWQFENQILSLSELLNWSEWEGAYSVWLAKKNVEELQRWTAETKTEWYNRINRVFKFQTSVLTLPKIEKSNQEQLSEICTVFEKLNSAGVSLTVYDLLTARLYPHGVHVDQLWKNSIDNYELFGKYAGENISTYGVLILRCIALMRSVDLKSKALVNLSPNNFNKDWDRAVHYFEEALKRLTSLSSDGFGVVDDSWLPSTTMIPVLAALIAKRDSLADSSRKATATAAIQAWYWGSVFTERFTGPVETTTQRDYTELSRYFEDNETTPEIFTIINNQLMRNGTGYTLLDVARTNSTIYKAVMCLLALNGAKDFQVNEGISHQILEDHHIFPKAYLNKNYDIPKGRDKTNTINTVLNRTLISRNTNRMIQAKSPSDYLADSKIIPQEHRENILAQHFIDSDALEAMMKNDYDAFILRREEIILTNLRNRLAHIPKTQTQEHLMVKSEAIE